MSDKVKAGKVFRKAVKGYRSRQKREEEERRRKAVPLGPPPEGYPYPYPVSVNIQGTAIHAKGEPVAPEKKEVEEGISLTETVPRYTARRRGEEEEVDIKRINISYALIPRGSRTPFAAANIRWFAAESALVYSVIEPKLTPDEIDILNKVKASLIEKLDIDFTTLRTGEAGKYLKDRFTEMLMLLAKDMTPQKQDQMLYYMLH